MRTRKKILLFAIAACIVLCPNASFARKSKVLYVNSYHRGYQWSDDIEKGLKKALGLIPLGDNAGDSSQSKVQLKIFRMNTKLNTSEAFKKKAGRQAKALIEQWQPDIVVTSDDNAAKYLILTHYMDTQLPFVFCGLNWDAAEYGFPASNVTGMVEVSPLLDTLDILKRYAKGDRIGYVGANEFTNRKILAHHQGVLGIRYIDGKLVSTMEEWEQAYLRLQDAVDLLVVMNPIGIPDWDVGQAETFVYANTRIPTGCTGDNTVRYVLLAKVKIAEEQGWWAGKTALKILGGTSPADIPITMNTNSRVFINMRLSDRLGIKFPMELIEAATLIEELPKRE